jgi:hypothetical protein
MRFIFLPFFMFQLSCDLDSGQTVLREYVRGAFLAAHNSHRKQLPELVWNTDISVRANSDALSLSGVCWINDNSIGGKSNVAQVWGSQGYTPKQVVDLWMRQDESKKVILEERHVIVGCGYVPCIDASSWSRSVIYVCHYETKE